MKNIDTELYNIIEALKNKNYYYFLQEEDRNNMEFLFFETKVDFKMELDYFFNESIALFEEIKTFKENTSIEKEMISLNFENKIDDLKNKIRNFLIKRKYKH